MENARELYCLGHSDGIDTRVGKIHFIKVKEYALFSKHVSFLLLEKRDIEDYIKALIQGDSRFESLYTFTENSDLLTIIKALKESMPGIYEGYKKLFEFCFKKDILEEIEDNEEFVRYIDIIKKINCVSHKKANPNPEIARFEEMKREYEEKKRGRVTFDSIYYSIWLAVGERPDEMTLYDFYSLFSRIGQFKNYDSTILFKTVTNEVNVEPWAKHIDILEDSEKKTTLKEFSEKANSIINTK